MKRCLPALDALEISPQLSREVTSQRVGLLTNHTGRTIGGKPALQVLQGCGLNVTALFSPEHGFAGKSEGKVLSSVTECGLPVHSLYGETRQPTAEMLQNIDVVVADLQDVGARFYTYCSTVALAMEKCTEMGRKIVVLDRPNPLGGIEVAGPLCESSEKSFVGHLDVPIIHGMTMGELMQWHRARHCPQAELEVIPVQNWPREMGWPQTGLEWHNPSPNLPDFQSAAWYPGLCLLEFCELSVGRGTDAPFRILGAPWMEPQKVLLAMQDWPVSLKSTFVAREISFIPTHGRCEGKTCHGLQFSAEQLAAPKQIVHLGMALLATLHQTHDCFDLDEMQKALPLLGSRVVLGLLQENKLQQAFDIAEQDAVWFREKRAPFLLY